MPSWPRSPNSSRASSTKKGREPLEIRLSPPASAGFSKTLLRRRRNIDLPIDRRPRMAAEEALRGHHQFLGVLGVRLHPGFAGRKPQVGGVADADEAEPPRFLQRRQARRPQFARRERR